jgi:uncharacterized protein (DUF58 family)
VRELPPLPPLLPSQRLAILIAAAGLTFLLGSPLAFALNVALIGVVCADALLLYRAPLPRVERAVPPRLPLGGTADTSYELRNDAGVGQTVRWTDDPGPGIARDGDGVHSMVLPPRSTVTVSAPVQGTARGATFLGDVHLRIRSPFGLLWRRALVRRRDATTVQPGLRELHHHRLLALQHRTELGVRRVREIGEGREFERLREYVRGDDPRRIDWKATARHGSPIVREYEAERSQSIMIVIDAGRLMAETFGGRERLDHALAAALVLADAAAVHGDAVGCMVFADSVQAYVPPGRNALARLADMFAEVETRRVEPDYPSAFRHLGRKLRRRSLVVIFTDVIDAGASAALLDNLGASARRHVPLIVALRNTELDDTVQAPVQDDAAAYMRAAAEELLQARAVALNTVRRRGVLVADVRPEAATGEALARYLEIKRRGLL